VPLLARTRSDSVRGRADYDVLVHGLRIRVLSNSGRPLRDLSLDASCYQPQAPKMNDIARSVRGGIELLSAA
jgi:hypothetical protein